MLPSVLCLLFASHRRIEAAPHYPFMFVSVVLECTCANQTNPPPTSLFRSNRSANMVGATAAARKHKQEMAAKKRQHSLLNESSKYVKFREKEARASKRKQELVSESMESRHSLRLQRRQPTMQPKFARQESGLKPNRRHRQHKSGRGGRGGCTCPRQLPRQKLLRKTPARRRKKLRLPRQVRTKKRRRLSS